MKTKNYIFSLTLTLSVFLASPSNAFTYDHKLIEYGGGIISQLNNCGVSYSPDGMFLRGTEGKSTKLDTKGEIESFIQYKKGIVSILSDRRVRFSPDPSNLDKGKIVLRVQESDGGPPMNGRLREQVMGSMGNPTLRISKHNDSVIIFTGRVAYKIDNIDSPNVNIKRTGYGPINYGVSVNNTIYLQYEGGDVEMSNSFSDIGARKHIVDRSAPPISEIIPYREGIATIAGTTAGEKVYYSNSKTNVTTGPNVKILYSGTDDIRHILNFGGKDGESSGLIGSFANGYVVYSPTGEIGLEHKTAFVLPTYDPFTGTSGEAYEQDIVTPRRNSYFLAKPINKQDVAIQLDRHISNMDSPLIASALRQEEINIHLLNRFQSVELAENFFLGESGGGSVVTGLLIDISGKAASVKLSDKGWSGGEYKWRYRGVRTGEVNHTNDGGKIIGDTGIKIEAHQGCTVIAALEQIDGSVDPFEKSWQLNADFSAPVNSSNDFWNTGGWDEAGGNPNNIPGSNVHTDHPPGNFFEWIVFHSIKADNWIYDKTGVRASKELRDAIIKAAEK